MEVRGEHYGFHGIRFPGLIKAGAKGLENLGNQGDKRRILAS